jgi:hypothetical protein
MALPLHLAHAADRELPAEVSLSAPSWWFWVKAGIGFGLGLGVVAILAVLFRLAVLGAIGAAILRGLS